MKCQNCNYELNNELSTSPEILICPKCGEILDNRLDDKPPKSIREELLNFKTYRKNNKMSKRNKKKVVIISAVIIILLGIPFVINGINSYNSDKLMDKAIKLAEKYDAKGARGAYIEALNINPNNRLQISTNSILNKKESEFKALELLKSAKNNLDAVKIDDAITDLNSAIAVYPDIKTTSEQITKEICQVIINNAKQLSQSEPDKAQDLANKAIKLDSSFTEATEIVKMTSEIIADRELVNTENYINSNDFDNAKKSIEIATKNDLSKIRQTKITELKNKINEKEELIRQQKEQQEELLKKQEKQQEMQSFKASCKRYEFKVLNKNPDSLEGNEIVITGKIIQILESYGSTTMRINITQGSYGFWSDTVMVDYPDKVNAYEDDIITIWGTIDGAYTYTSTMNASVTVPLIIGKYSSK